MKQVNYSLSPHVRRCVRFYGAGGARIPRQENARRPEAFLRHFRPDTAVRKWHYDKGRYTQGRTSHPQSPATRVFSDFRQGTHFQETQNFR